ncbi:uncharacterized protein PRCAT00002110001 [Priceomyces carsonii]|uniref:uncharacterized protein n=1 Tax=Priceomyces carsonii TaxID=28549 RepID=UPI002ED7E524|nr:unnamed protein product [Priceomyces carsonii]
MISSLSRVPMRIGKLIFMIVVTSLVLIFTLQRFHGQPKLASIKIINPYEGRSPIIETETTRTHFTGTTRTPFEKKLEKLFEKVALNKDKYWLANTGLTETTFGIKITDFLKDLTSQTAWVNRSGLYYDPRLTLSIYLSELKNKYLLKSKGNKVELNKIEPVVLPFNWADWMDLTVLNDDLNRPMNERISCTYIRQHTNNDPDPSYFCIDNDKVADSFVESLGYKRRQQLPGFIIHDHSSHDDRPLNDFRVLEAKSYAMTHLPKPLKVIILNGGEGGGTYEFEVDPESNQRLVTSDMIENFLKSKGINPAALDGETILKLDHTLEFEDLLSSVTPHYLPDEEDHHGMYRSLRKQTDPKSSRQLTVPEELFHYPKSMIPDQIYFYEHYNTVPLDKLSRQERLYYDGLKTCQLYNDSNEPTYFKMAVIRIDDERNVDHEWGWHYDWRFFNGALNYQRPGWTELELIQRTNIILDRLLRSWFRFAEEKGIITWIMHGPLLSWYWDGLMFPFDVDIDIQMPAIELARLAKDYNQTLVVEDPKEGYGKFLIDVGTYIHNRGISLQNNHIDARFVDVDSGIYIDITSLSKSRANTPEEYTNNPLVSIEKGLHDDQTEIYNDRRKHFYKLDQLSPLKYSMLCGVPVYVPLTITDRLTFEYPNGVTSYEFNGWYFVPQLMLWLKKEQVAAVFKKEDILQEDGNINHIKLIDQVKNMSDEQVLKLLENDDILVEYYLTKEMTDIHEKEFHLMFDSIGRDKEITASDEEYHKLVSTFRMHKPLRKALWDFENLERPKHHRDYP